MVKAGVALVALAGPAWAGILHNYGEPHVGPTAPIKPPSNSGLWTASEPHWVTKTTTYVTTTCPVTLSTVTSGTKTLTVPITLTKTRTITTITVCDLNTEPPVVVPTGAVTGVPLVPTSVLTTAPAQNGQSSTVVSIPPPKPAPFTNSTAPSVPTVQPVPIPPVVPGHPPAPGQPSVPGQPVVPGQPGIPTQPSGVAPVSPGQPVPQQPGIPAQPPGAAPVTGQPSAPQQPGAPAQPSGVSPVSPTGSSPLFTGSASQIFQPAAGFLVGVMGIMLIL